MRPQCSCLCAVQIIRAGSSLSTSNWVPGNKKQGLGDWNTTTTTTPRTTRTTSRTTRTTPRTTSTTRGVVLVILFVVLVVLEVVLVVLGVVLVVLGVVLRQCFWANYKDFLMLDLQTAYFKTPEELQTWDLVENDRLDEL